MAKRWFMSYAQVYRRGVFQLCYSVYDGDEHPVARARRWTDSYGTKDGFVAVVLSFAEAGPDVPECDVVGPCIPG